MTCVNVDLFGCQVFGNELSNPEIKEAVQEKIYLLPDNVFSCNFFVIQFCIYASVPFALLSFILNKVIIKMVVQALDDLTYCA